MLDDSGFLLAVIGVGWSALLALLRRAIASVEEKLDGAAKRSAELSARIEELRGKLDDAHADARDEMDAKVEGLRSQAVSRHEFNLLAGNIQSMVEAIYNYVISHGVRD
jgi:F0F1-type ATP synthase membrane subunit b/b'